MSSSTTTNLDLVSLDLDLVLLERSVGSLSLRPSTAARHDSDDSDDDATDQVSSDLSSSSDEEDVKPQTMLYQFKRMFASHEQLVRNKRLTRARASVSVAQKRLDVARRDLYREWNEVTFKKLEIQRLAGANKWEVSFTRRMYQSYDGIVAGLQKMVDQCQAEYDAAVSALEALEATA